MSRLALVTGGTGFIGSHLVETLLHRGWLVRCTVRQTSDTRWLDGKTIERVEADLRTGRNLDRICRGVDTVFHLAGVIWAPSFEKFREGNWLATKHLAEASVAAGVRRFLYASSLAAAGPTSNGTPLDESMKPNPISAYGATKLLGEEEALRHADRMAVTAFRPPMVFGPRDRAMLPFYRLMKYGIRASIGGPKRFSLIHIRDLIDGLVAAVDAPASHGKSYFLTHERSVTMEELGRILEHAVGRNRSRRVHVPDDFIRWLGAVAEWIPMIRGLDRNKAHEITQKGWLCTSARAREDFGFEARVSHEVGMREAVAWCREEKLL